MSDLVLVTDHSGVRVVTFHRPERHNALSDALLATWRDALTDAFADPGVRSVVLAGAGPSFSSGRDLAQLGRRPSGQSDFAFVLDEQRAALALREAPKPVVAALHGHVIGGAFELALHADLRIAADDTVLRLPEIERGILPDVGGIEVLHRLTGPSRTKRLVMTGEPIDAATALAWGIVDDVVSADELDDVALGVAERLAAAPPLAIRRAKELVDAISDDSVRAGFARELRVQTELFARARAARSVDGDRADQ